MLRQTCKWIGISCLENSDFLYFFFLSCVFSVYLSRFFRYLSCVSFCLAFFLFNILDYFDISLIVIVPFFLAFFDICLSFLYFPIFSIFVFFLSLSLFIFLIQCPFVFLCFFLLVSLILPFFFRYHFLNFCCCSSFLRCRLLSRFFRYPSFCL